MGIVYHAFPPLVGDKPKVLVLGTFPSPLSREKGEYYGNPRNQFWRLLFGVFCAEFDNPNYEKKKTLLFKNSIALWDVVASCEADGALDSELKNIVYNMALPVFIEEHGIRKVLFNGNNAYLFYRRGIGAAERNVLPSGSPANARTTYEEKLRLWREIL